MANLTYKKLLSASDSDITALESAYRAPDTARFLIAIMHLLFVAPAVSILGNWDVIAPNVIAIVVIMCLSTVIVFAVAGLVTKWLLGKEGRENG